MPKAKQSLSSRLKYFVELYGSDFKTDGNILYCKICEKAISADKKFAVDQHLKSAVHLNGQKKMRDKTQRLLSEPAQNSSKKSEFFSDMCEAFVAANIPLWKLQNSTFSAFLQKYTGKEIPSESTLRKNYLKKVYDATMDRIR